MALEFFVPASQDGLIGSDLVEAPADFSRSLCGHAAMLVEFDRLVLHRPLPWSSGIPSFGCPDLAVPGDLRLCGGHVEPVAVGQLSRPSLSHQMELRIGQFNAGAHHCFLFWIGVVG